jgi:hypothetical protein
LGEENSAAAATRRLAESKGRERGGGGEMRRGLGEDGRHGIGERRRILVG